MNVEIIIEKNNKLSFEMTDEQVSKMLVYAFGNVARHAKENDDVEDDSTTLGTHNEETKTISYKKPEIIPHSKVDRMFGSDWRNCRSQSNYRFNKDSKPQLGFSKGFLLLECPSCGKVKAFCTKSPIRTSFCSCGFEIELKDLKKARLDCKCGNTWNYMTNIHRDNYTLECLHCKSPIDIVYNPRHDCYETMI